MALLTEIEAELTAIQAGDDPGPSCPDPCRSRLGSGDYTAKEALAREQAELTGIYAGNPKRGTATPTTEQMLRAFDNIHLMPSDELRV